MLATTPRLELLIQGATSGALNLGSRTLIAYGGPSQRLACEAPIATLEGRVWIRTSQWGASGGLVHTDDAAQLPGRSVCCHLRSHLVNWKRQTPAIVSVALMAGFAAPGAIAAPEASSVPATTGAPSAPSVVQFTLPATEPGKEAVRAECRLIEEGRPHVRTSTGGAGAKARVNCSTPVASISLTGEMYYYWGDWLPQVGSPISHSQNFNMPTLTNDRTSSAPCPNANPTWWYAEFNAVVEPVRGGETFPLSLTSSEAELNCGPS